MDGKTKQKELIKKYSVMAEKCSRIDPDLYKKYEVKRGLRDISGRGVLAGLIIGKYTHIIDEGNGAGAGRCVQEIDIMK